MRKIYILGVGGSTLVFMDLALSCGYEIAGLYHYRNDRTGENEHGYSILGSFDDLFKADIKGKLFLLSQGDMRIRKEITDKIVSRGGVVPTLIHPSAEISNFAKISDNGVVIGAKCVVQADAEIKSNSVIRDMALICHQTTIGNYVFVGPMALVGAHTHVGDFAFIGQDALLVSGKVGNVGAHSLVGAGAVATKEIPSGVVVVGSPARIIRRKS